MVLRCKTIRFNRSKSREIVSPFLLLWSVLYGVSKWGEYQGDEKDVIAAEKWFVLFLEAQIYISEIFVNNYKFKAI